MIAVVRSKKSMKKLILKVKGKKSSEEMASLTKRMNRQWNNGLIVIPEEVSYQMIEEEWINCEKCVPKEGETVLVWAEYEKDGEIGHTYDFGTVQKNGWSVCFEETKRVIAWMPLPEPYKVGDV